MPGTRPLVDADTFAVLSAVAKAAGELNIEWMVVGAAGRVMLLEGVYGFPHGRATQDVDLGVMVASWQQYQVLVERIRLDDRFQPDPKQRQRLRFGDDGILDLVPFGAIESDNRVIYWPPDRAFAMTVRGFREACADTVKVSLDGLSVPVVSPAGLVLLKFVAWSERHQTQPGRDAADLAYVLRYFSAILSEAVLFEKHFEAMEAADYDIDLAASRVLGERLAALVAADTWRFVRHLLDGELQQATDSQLVRDINAYLPGTDGARTFALLESLRAGFLAGERNEHE